MHRILNQILPFVMAGIAIVAFAFGIMLLAYLFFFGALLGFALFSISWVKAKLFPSKVITRVDKHQGRTFDSDQWKKM